MHLTTTAQCGSAPKRPPLFTSSHPKPKRLSFRRQAWLAQLCCVIIFCSGQSVHGQLSEWRSGVANDLFKDDQTKDAKPKPTHRLAPAPSDCPQCQTEIDKLQTALDDWYSLQLADAEKNIRESLSGTSPGDKQKQLDARTQKADALAGLGQKPKAPPKGKTKAGLKSDIAKLSIAVRKCLDDCKPKESESPSPTKPPTSDEKPPVAGDKPPALSSPVELPEPQKCFNSEAERQAFINKWDPIASEERSRARSAKLEINAYTNDPRNPWAVYWKGKAAMHEKSATALQTIVDDAENPTKTPVPCPTPSPKPSASTEAIDPCLVGTWECISFKEAVSSVTEGGTGFRVTFKSDGTEIVDYSTMKTIKSGNDTTSYTGTATARISTKDGVAKIESMENAGVTATLKSSAVNKDWKLPGLGVAGLGSTKDKNGYKCGEDSLEYQSSAARDGRANCTVKLKRVKP